MSALPIEEGFVVSRDSAGRLLWLWVPPGGLALSPATVIDLLATLTQEVFVPPLSRDIRVIELPLGAIAPDCVGRATG